MIIHHFPRIRSFLKPYILDQIIPGSSTQTSSTIHLFHQQQLLLSISSTTTPSKFQSSLQLIKPSNLWKFIKFLLQLLLKTPYNLDPIIQSLNQKFLFFHFRILTIIRTWQTIQHNLNPNWFIFTRWSFIHSLLLAH